MPDPLRDEDATMPDLPCDESGPPAARRSIAPGA